MATIPDIAAATGRSTATVDRVLNNRPGVREATRRTILEAADRLGYVHAMAARKAFDLVLPAAGAFMHALADHARRENASGRLARDIRVHPIDYADPLGIARLLRDLRERSAGVGLVAVDHGAIREALRTLIVSNVPVVTMLTDISSLPHQGYIGIDNRLAGRLAGWLIGRFLPRAPADVAVFTGSRAYRGHEEREMGFRSIVREQFAHLAIREVLEIGEDAEAGFAATRRLLAAGPVAALYNIGAGTAGIARALERLPAAEKPVFVAHDLSADTRAHLVSGAIDAIVDQSAEATVRRTVDRLAAAAASRMLGVCDVMEPRILVLENMPVA